MAAVTSARRSRRAFLGSDTRRAGVIFVLAALLVLASVELGVGLRVFGVGPRLPGAPNLDYTGMPHPVAPLGARFIESVLGDGSADLAGGTLARSEGSVDVDGDVLAAGSDLLQVSERVVDTHLLTNDDRENARVIPSIPFTARTNDSDATREDSDPGRCSPTGGTVWYRFTPEQDVGLVAFTYGTDHSVALGVFEQAERLRKIGCDIDPRGNALFAFPAKAGHTYFLQLTAPAEAGKLVVHLEAHGDFELISRARGGAAANGLSGSHARSANGRYIAFTSRATNLVPGVDDSPCETRNPIYARLDGTPCGQIYVRDLRTDRIELVSVARDGRDGDGESFTPFISADGRYVAFESAARNLHREAPGAFSDVFVYDRWAKRMEWIAPATPIADAGFAHPSLSDDGRYVAFATSQPLVPDDINGLHDVYVFDRKKDRFELVTVSPDGRPSEYSDPRSRKVAPCLGPISYAGEPSPAMNFPDYNPYISGDGRWIVFRSDATNLVTDDNNGEWDAFVRDRETGRTERVSVSSSGEEGNGSTYHNAMANPQVSADGRYVVFSSCASNLSADDDDELLDAFWHDRRTGRTTLLSGVVEGDVAGFPTISRDGRYVTFDSQPFDKPNTTEFSDVYWHDTLSGATSFVTLTPFGTDSSGWTGTISADGKAVLFVSSDRHLGRTGGLDNTFLYRVPKSL